MMAHEITMLLSGVLRQIRLIAPYWAIGLLVGSLISVYLAGKISERMLALSSKGRGLWQICVASLLGIVSPLCMFGTIPVIAALGKKGLPGFLLAAFMVSSVMLNPNLLFLTIVLGRNLALMRFAFCFLGGALAGVLVLRFCGDTQMFKIQRFAAEGPGQAKTLLPDLLKAARVTAPYLLVGIALTAVLDRYIPPEWIYRMFGARRGLGVLFATTLSVPLYACGGGVIPLINAWLHAGMGRGDALAFMLAGPATKINSISAVKMILGGRNFLIYLTFCIAFAAAVGLFVEFVLGG